MTGNAEPAAPLTILHTDFHRGWGGQINRVLVECRGLLARGHRVVLAIPGGGRPVARAREWGIPLFEDVRFRPVSRVRSLFADAYALQRLLDALRPDIVHSHGSQDTWAVALANRLLPRPKAPALLGGGRGARRALPGHAVHVLTRHNTKKVRDSLANRWLFRRAVDGLIVVARDTLECYEPLVRRGLIDPRKVSVLPSPLRPDLLEGTAPDGRRVRDEIGAGPGDFVAGTLARLVPDKGQRHLLEAMAALQRELPASRLVLAGDGESEPALREQARAAGIADRVHFLGFREDVAEILAALDVAVLPSVGCDASSGMLKEALALGVPVVATEIGDARAILGDGAFGLVVPPGDAPALAAAIASVARDLPAARSRAAAGGRHVRETYTVERLVDGLEQTYRDLLATVGMSRRILGADGHL
ncbi:MAG: glycosyltransferase family 4 protein [Acidobacteria bacterium]|nr:glycosyltransferase family 4 protein [Acidobacteriota bacterium]